MIINILIRMLLAALGVLLFNAALPAFLSLVGYNPPADLMTLVRIVTFAVAVAYVIWGKTVYTPS